MHRTSRLLASDDIVEEWFIDKHLYHFSARTLTRMIEAAGFTIVEHPDPKDRSNLFYRRAQERPQAIARRHAICRKSNTRET